MFSQKAGSRQLGIGVGGIIWMILAILVSLLIFAGIIFLAFIVLEELGHDPYMLIVNYFGIDPETFEPISSSQLSDEFANRTAYFLIFLLLMPFVFVWLAMIFIVKVVYRRPIWLFGWDQNGVDWKMLGVSIAVFSALYILSIAVGFAFGLNRFVSYPEGALMMVPIFALLILIQTSAEEYLFRGYFQSLFYDWFASRWVWSIVPSVMFALLHYDSTTFGENNWWVLLAVFMLGMVAAELTYKTGSIIWATGLHFVNNFFVLLIINARDAPIGFGFIEGKYGPSDVVEFRNMIFAQILLFAVIYVIIYRMPRRAINP